ncbi:hypothetical protein G7075_00055 [Phycicoccus sp. HDW14]|uniref:hypothetical protein n=1 Tax=Phycicoccus sp. HDW14 TaxID=2714941 RepID=UPI001409BF30|nr:hypothetical protein [Phycicoccus sp. HDW14]QIM19889.1 hypothetical protein G7075_00055 [Phycicoccus sp. HDW14]
MAQPDPYGADHQRRRALAIEEAYNTPCPRCGLPMLRGQKLHFGHTRDRAIEPWSKADRIEHADYDDCPLGGNTAAGGVLGRQIQDLQPSRVW